MKNNMRLRKMFVLTLFVVMNIAVGQTKPQESCITAKCHASYGKEKHVHGPVAVGECTPCHELIPNEKHTFKPLGSSETLCNKCHEPMTKKAVVHTPVAKGECTGCHDAHQSNQMYQLKKNSLAEMCLSCHGSELMKKKFKHSPAAEGECLTCHSPHSSEKPKLLSRTGNEVCFECHSDMKESFAQAKNIHKPAAENCVQCHNPHSNDVPFMLAKDLPDQCYSCHKDFQSNQSKVLVKHQALEKDKKCVNCHSPHDSKFTAQLKDEPMALCLTCHNQELQTHSDDNLADMKKLFEKNKDWHGPIKDRDCSGCHDTHGSEHFRILRQDYPKEFYISFAQNRYELCFSCHEPTLVQDAKTTTLTGFRNGERNLHFLHVNRKAKGRTCRSCHETHASQKARHIREEVPFGQWMLPIKFEKTTNGGKCSPGCHVQKEYTRALNESKK